MRILFLGLLMTAQALSAQTADSPMAGAFGNTIVSVQPGGMVTRTYVDPDGTYRSVTNDLESSGRWEIKKGLICYSAGKPAPAPPLCSLGPKKKLGAKWRIFQPDDNVVMVSIVAGRP